MTAFDDLALLRPGAVDTDDGRLKDLLEPKAIGFSLVHLVLLETEHFRS